KEGWLVVEALHTGQPPKEGKSASRTLVTLLGNLHRALDQLNLSFQDFFEGKQQKPRSEVGVEARVRAAYAELAPGPGEWVGLADLRDHLADLSRTDVDEAL